MFQSNTMKIFTPPLPPPQSMLCFQYTHHDTRKPNAQHDPTLNRGRGGIAFGNKMYIGGICPNTFESDCSKESSPYHPKNFCFFLKPNSFLIDRIGCQGTKNLASTRKKTKFLVVISLRMQVFPITTIRFKNPAKISRFVYSTHSPFNACADKCPLCSRGVFIHIFMLCPTDFVSN